MKNLKQISLFIILAVVLSACEDTVTTEISYIANVPLYKSRAELKTEVKNILPITIKKAGKIYIKGNYLFVNEVNKGIHVFDNTNPASPKMITFFNIPGNVDMAIKGNTLYADSHTDLLEIDISDLNNIREINRIENAFTNALPEYNIEYPTIPIDKNKGIVVGWKTEEVIIKKDKQTNNNTWYSQDGLKLSVSSSNENISASVGIAGSMARFAIHENVLYTITNNVNIQIFNIEGSKIADKGKLRTNWGIETLFTYNKNLFIGSRRGMFIYDISNAEKPIFISQYIHITSCDPVVVDDKYAYVTLRSGTNCNGTANQLDIISLEDITQPKLVKSYNLSNPHGLGIDKNILFICDGKDGLKIYDATDVTKITDNMLAHFKNIQTYDLIPFNKVLIMTGTDGIYQYDYTDIKNIKQISHISVSN